MITVTPSVRRRSMSFIPPDLYTIFCVADPRSMPIPDLGAARLAGNVDGAGRRRSLVRIVHRGMVVAEHVRLERSIAIGSPKAAPHPGQRRPRAPKRWLGLS